MGDEAVQNLRDGIKEIKNTLKWTIVLLSTILLAMIGVIGSNTVRSVENRKDIERYDIAIKEMVTKQQMARLIEFSRIRKELIKATLSEHSDEEVDILWQRLEELEMMVVEDDYGFYTRGIEEDAYRERTLKGND